MPPALQVINCFKQGLTGGGGFADDLAVSQGDSLTFGTFQSGRAWFANIAGVSDSGAAEFSVTAPEMHDQIEGIAGWVPDGSTTAPPNRASSISPPGYDEPVFPAESLTVRVAGANGANVNAVLSVYYEDLPGISGLFLTAAAVRAATKHLVGVDVAIDASTVGQGEWSTPVAISAAGRRLDANRKYACLGFTSDVPCAAVGISGFETGNLRLGGPVVADAAIDANMFARASEIYGTPLVPVFQGFNQDSILVAGADPAASNVNLTVLFADLTGGR